MAQNLGTKVDVGVGVIGIIAETLAIRQLPAAHQYHETTLSAAGIGILWALFGIKTLVALQR